MPPLRELPGDIQRLAGRTLERIAQQCGLPKPIIGRSVLTALRWNRTAAAKKLGMTLRSLRYRLSKLGIE